VYEIDPDYGTYVTIKDGYNAPFIVIGEPGEGSIYLRARSARRLLAVLPEIIRELDKTTNEQLDT
jgi:hypothetical protein